jgi:hypothetical protein
MAQSAKGLFRATGKTSVNGQPRETNDFYPTPPEPFWALLDAEGDRIPKRVWEPAVGDGAMAYQLRDVGRDVVASDIIDRGYPGTELKSFFDYETAPASAIVTNPPFNAVNWRDGKGRWIEHALGKLGIRYMALLLPWGWPGAAGLRTIWSDYPPARVYLMRWKIDFTGAGAPPMLNGWYVWDAAVWAEAPELRMLDRVPEPGFAGVTRMMEP